MIILKNIYKKYPNCTDQNILHNISLHIKKGDIFGLIGFSGAGKSTLLRTINLLEKPTSGKIIVDGIELNNLDNRSLAKARKNIGMVFQHFNLIKRKNIKSNISIGLEVNKVKKEVIEKRINEVTELVDLKNLLKKYPNNISGGQKQRVGIARALMNKPKILLCDEATSALDPVTTLSILKLLKEINKKMGLTIVLITHEIEVVKEICNKMAVIHKGKIIESGFTDYIFSHPRNKITKMLINHTLEDNNFTFSSSFSGSEENLQILSSLPFIKITESNIKTYNNIVSGTLKFKVTLPINNIDAIINSLGKLGLTHIKSNCNI